MFILFLFLMFFFYSFSMSDSIVMSSTLKSISPFLIIMYCFGDDGLNMLMLPAQNTHDSSSLTGTCTGWLDEEGREV